MGWLQANYPDGIRPKPDAKWKGYGDWLSINADTPPEYIGTAFYAYCATLMSKMATALGRTEEAATYIMLAMQVVLAFRQRFVRGQELTVKTQTAYVLALHFDLLDEKDRPAALQALVADIQSRGTHLSTGFVGTPYLNHVLTRFGRSDVAYALLQQTTFPSWLYPITQGATTMWERWDAYTHDKGFNDAGMNSYNHYAFGAIGDWLYSTVAGIDLDPQQPGYQHILIRPRPGGTITWARGSLKSPYGLIESAWRLDGEWFHLDVSIPPNTTASIRLPDDQGIHVGAGKHAFDVKIKRS
jgi:alpha-L-rhamnosidase